MGYFCKKLKKANNMPGYNEPHLLMEGCFYQKYRKISNTMVDLKGLFTVEDKSSKN